MIEFIVILWKKSETSCSFEIFELYELGEYIYFIWAVFYLKISVTICLTFIIFTNNFELYFLYYCIMNVFIK